MLITKVNSPYPRPRPNVEDPPRDFGPFLAWRREAEPIFKREEEDVVLEVWQ